MKTHAFSIRIVSVLLALVAIGSLGWPRSSADEVKLKATLGAENVPTEPVTSLAFSPDGKTLVTGSASQAQLNGGVTLWDVASGKETIIIKRRPRWVCYVAFSPNGKTLLWASGDGTVTLWDMASAKGKMTLERPGVVLPQSEQEFAFVRVSGNTLTKANSCSDWGKTVAAARSLLLGCCDVNGSVANSRPIAPPQS